MRSVDAGFLGAIASDAWRPVAGVRLDWPGGEVRYHSRIGPMALDGEVWQGVGSLGSIEGLQEVEGLGVREIVLGLTGFLADQIAKVRGVKIRNRAAKVYIGAVDAQERQIGAMVRLFSGKMRAKSFEVREAAAEGFEHLIQVRVQNHVAAARRAVDVRHEHPRLAALRHETPQWPE